MCDGISFLGDIPQVGRLNHVQSSLGAVESVAGSRGPVPIILFLLGLSQLGAPRQLVNLSSQGEDLLILGSVSLPILVGNHVLSYLNCLYSSMSSYMIHFCLIPSTKTSNFLTGVVKAAWKRWVMKQWEVYEGLTILEWISW